MNTQISSDADSEVLDAARLFKLLGDPTRLGIVSALCGGERSVNHLSAQLGAQPAAVSQHLAKLHLARIVTRRREGTFVYYAIDDDRVSRLVHEVLPGAETTLTSRTSRLSHDTTSARAGHHVVAVVTSPMDGWID